jgi:hypothetical protein
VSKQNVLLCFQGRFGTTHHGTEDFLRSLATQQSSCYCVCQCESVDPARAIRTYRPAAKMSSRIRCRYHAASYTDTRYTAAAGVPAWVHCTRSVPKIEGSQDQRLPRDLRRFVRIIGCVGPLGTHKSRSSCATRLVQAWCIGTSVRLLAIQTSLS